MNLDNQKTGGTNELGNHDQLEASGLILRINSTFQYIQ
jgi:hypothetical protein